MANPHRRASAPSPFPTPHGQEVRSDAPKSPRTPTMKIGETLVEFYDGLEWRPGVVVESSRHRLTVAVMGVREHRAYLQRHTGNWRYVPENLPRARRDARDTAIANWSKQ